MITINDNDYDNIEEAIDDFINEYLNLKDGNYSPKFYHSTMIELQKYTTKEYINEYIISKRSK